VDLDEIWYGSDDTEGNLDSILINYVASTISKWRTSKVLRWAQILNRLVDLDEILYEDPVNSISPKWRTLNFWGVSLTFELIGGF
jgi:hypothetical protein